MLELKNVALNYYSKNGETMALKDVSFKINDGELISIVGPSGCGKTTILSLISGLIKPTNGEVLINNEPVKSQFCGYMFQKDHLFDWRTIEKNILLGLEVRKYKNKYGVKNIKTNHFKDRLKQKNEQFNLDKEYALSLLKKYGLWEFKDKYPNQLSGGMRQRVSLIRTLALKPEIMLLDEPFSALDFQTRLNLCDDVYKILKSENKTAVLVTHDISEAISMSDRIIVLSKRPAVVKNEHKISLKAETPLKRREETGFNVYFNEIWKELTWRKILILNQLKKSQFVQKNMQHI